MPKLSRGVLRLLAVLALVAVIQPLAGTLVQGDEAGRNFSRCIRACNDIRRECDDRCSADCTDMFPGTPNKAARDACIAACRTICGNESDDCKLICQQNRDETPEEP